LYRLPELLAALEERPDRWVVVVEGEKDADNLTALGLLATTNSGGAGKWSADYTATLRGRNVAVLIDYDNLNQQTGKRPGWEHAKQVANALLGTAAKVRVVMLPGQEPGQDVSAVLAKLPGTMKADERRRWVADAILGSPEWSAEVGELLEACLDTGKRLPGWPRLIEQAKQHESYPPALDVPAVAESLPVPLTALEGLLEHLRQTVDQTGYDVRFRLLAELRRAYLEAEALLLSGSWQTDPDEPEGAERLMGLARVAVRGALACTVGGSNEAKP
jgi:hypothetical protein